MKEERRKVKVLNEYGIHARPAALFVKMATKYASDIMVEKDGIQVSGKSIMGLLTMEGHQGAELVLCAKGHDAAEALAALEQLFHNKFFED